MKKKLILALLSGILPFVNFVFCKEKGEKLSRLESIVSPSNLIKISSSQLEKLGLTQETSGKQQEKKQNPFIQEDKNLVQAFSLKSDPVDNFGEGDPWDD